MSCPKKLKLTLDLHRHEYRTSGSVEKRIHLYATPRALVARYLDHEDVTYVSRILILFAHPTLEKSRVHRRLISRIPDRPEITFHDLYEAYPDFDVDIPREQDLMVNHDMIILQHPFFWYGTPPLIKQWEDLVLEHGWAFGSAGTALHGKQMLSLITTGGRADAYCPEGYNRFTIRQFLVPLEGTARLCGMTYLPPYVIYGTHQMNTADIEAESERYGGLLNALADDRIDYMPVLSAETLNRTVAETIGTEARS